MPLPPQLPLLLFHGLLSSPQEFGLIAHMLRSRGIAHHSVSVPGYTLSNDPRPPDWQQWRAAAGAVIDHFTDAEQPVIVGGLCMGGVLAAAAALQSKRPIAGLILMSPTFTYDGWGLSATRHLRHFGYWTGLDRFFSVKEREPYGIKSAKIRQWVQRELSERAQSAAGPERIPLRAVREGERMMAEVRRQLGTLNCPLLLIHAREDEICRLSSVQHLFDSLPQADKELAILENSYHMITIDHDRQEVSTLIERFVKRVSSRGPTLYPS